MTNSSEEPYYDVIATRDKRGYIDDLEYTGLDRGEKNNLLKSLEDQGGFSITIIARWPFGVGFYEDWSDE